NKERRMKKQKLLSKKTFGQHEVEGYNGDDTDIQNHVESCRKNPGHANFIPITRFTQTDLPEDLQDDTLYELIKAISDITVRIRVTKVSPGRPQFFPNTEDPYPFSGTNVKMRLGSGEIDVYKFIKGCGYNSQGRSSNFFDKDKAIEATYSTCPCEKCGQSDKPKEVWWEIFVYTAAHVVFDEIEAINTTCTLLYDNKGRPETKALNKFSVSYVSVEYDKCELKHVTCDVSLGDKLYKMSRRCCDLWEEVRPKYCRSQSKFMFLVSHPHGGIKQLSLGEWRENEKVKKLDKNFVLTKLTYTAGTCPGSSGAHVYCLGFRGGHLHGGALEPNINYSCVLYTYKTKSQHRRYI
ncbi:hypothetical protein BgiBS90_028076, partial [Biomphalaria glabrata]